MGRNVQTVSFGGVGWGFVVVAVVVVVVVLIQHAPLEPLQMEIDSVGRHLSQSS